MAKTELVVGLGDRLYSVERPWGETPPGIVLGAISDVAVDAQDRVYVYQRMDPPVVVFDRSGTYLGSWGSGVLLDAHGISCSPSGQVVVTDRDAHEVLAFDADGNLKLRVGTRHRPRLQEPFNHPADVTVAANGDLYVADGYANSRVHCFGADGAWKLSWGKPGDGPGEFTTPHAVRIHPDGRVLVADRENNRVQVFTPEGKYLDSWGDVFHPMDVYIDREGFTYVTDQIPRMTMFSADGEVVGRCRPVLIGAHGAYGDSHGDLYMAEVAPLSRITKLVRFA